MGRTITNEDVAEYIIRKLEKQATNFDQSFVWRKKILRDIARGVCPDIFSSKTERKRQREREEEIEKGKKRRKLRSMEKAHKEEEMALLDRERDWIESELGKRGDGEFVYNQSKIRSQIRLQEGRANPMDILSNQLNPLNDVNMKTDGSLPPPYTVLENSTVKEGSTEDECEEPELLRRDEEDNIESVTTIDKFSPRKPKYFNRVHTGYQWNKYNQIHYDHNNPPPKYVLGYKFNVFYPDLIDTSKTPYYTIEEDKDSSTTCIIKFHGGSPYEDIAFRIVNGEWDYSKKKGFKCRFERGILQLNFNFKRYPYRR